MKCPKCNFENPGDAKSCLICGADFVIQAKPIPPPVPPAGPGPAPQQPPPPPLSQPPQQPHQPRQNQPQNPQYQHYNPSDAYLYHQFKSGEGYERQHSSLMIGSACLIIGIILFFYSFFSLYLASWVSFILGIGLMVGGLVSIVNGLRA